jgi:hypothetical protein
VKIDLFNNEIVVVFGGQTERFGAADNAVAKIKQNAASGRVPVEVYVFGHGFYRDITDNLKALGWDWREVSVPQALRDARPETRGQAWSTGFLELIARPSGRTAFRAALAELLHSSSTDATASEFLRGDVAASRQQPTATIDKLARWSRAALNALAIFGGLIFVVWVEMRRN